MNTYECDQKYTLDELKAKARAAGLSTSGSKKTLCAELIRAGVLEGGQTETGQERKFEMGQLVWTRGVNDLVAENEEFAKFVTESLRRHARGDWGDLSEEDKRENEYALGKYLRLLSAYEKPPLPKIWIITEADRSVTTVLFPEEY